jgi:hypothetical protein
MGGRGRTGPCADRDDPVRLCFFMGNVLFSASTREPGGGGGDASARGATPPARPTAWAREKPRKARAPGPGEVLARIRQYQEWCNLSPSPTADDGRAQGTIMAGTGSSGKKKVWQKILVVFVTTVVCVGLTVYWKRYPIAVRYMEGNKKAQEIIILQMLEIARPIIERDFKMTLPEKLISSIMGHRDEKERQTGALKDVRTFCELSFRNHWLKFEDVHRLGSLNGFDLRGFDFALTWKREKPADVLTAFEINFLKRVIDRMQLNQSSLFFTELRLYVEKKAKMN